MGNVITFHSYKGGTGKSIIAANIANFYALAGKNVCLLDYDFRTPSLNVLFKGKEPMLWLNNFLDGEGRIEDVLVDLSQRFNSEGKFFVGFADPCYESEREALAKDEKWQIGALRRTLSAIEFLSDKMNMDYIILDTAPGYNYPAINAITCSKEVVLVMSTSEFDTEGTTHMIQGIYELLEKKIRILVNKVPEELIPSEEDKNKLATWYKDKFQMDVFGLIPCYCAVLIFGAKPFFALQQPEHPFSKALKEVAEKLK